MSCRVVLLLAVSILTVGCDGDFKARPIPAAHPFVGRWHWSVPNSRCFEEIRIRPDGTRSGMSGGERIESEFRISEEAGVRGFYQWTDKVVRSNGEPDCSGHSTPVGDVVTNYVRFARDGKQFVVCPTPRLSFNCFGPFERREDGVT